MIHDPSDEKLTTLKIAHDYGLKFVTPKVIKVYYAAKITIVGKQSPDDYLYARYGMS